MQQKTFSRGFTKAGGTTAAPVAASTKAAAPAATGKKEYQHKADHVGYLKESEAGNQILVVEQDITLSKGDKIILKSPLADIDQLVAREFITEDEGLERKSRVPEWKLAVAKVLPKR